MLKLILNYLSIIRIHSLIEIIFYQTLVTELRINQSFFFYESKY